jgi:hypothetical protein
MFRYVGEELWTPLPTASRIVPLWVAHWNGKKPGSDTFSELLAEVGFRVPVKDAQAHIVGHDLKMLSAFELRCHQLLTPDKSVKECETLQRYRQNASKRVTFKESLKDQAKALLTMFSPVPNEEPDENTARTSQQPDLPASSATAARRATRSATRVETIPCPYLVTGSTPKKNVRRQYRREEGRRLIDRSIKRRYDTCDGSLCIRTNPDAINDPRANRRSNGGSGSCVVCGNRTPWWCGVCRHYYCGVMSTGRKKKCTEREAEISGTTAEFLRLGQETCGGNTRDVVVEKTCFLVHHECAFQKSLRETDNNVVANLYEINFQNSL